MTSTFYVLASIDNNPTLFRVRAGDITQSINAVNEYCEKRYSGTSIDCYVVEAFFEDVYKESLPHALVSVNCDDDREAELIVLSDVSEYREVVEDYEEEYPECLVESRLIFMSDVERRIARFYEMEKGLDIERAVERARMVADRVVDLDGTPGSGEGK